MLRHDQLQIISADGDVIFYTLDPGRGLTNIGRDPENDIVLDDPGVAEFQAILYHNQKPYRLVILDPDGQVILAGELQVVGDSITLQSREQLQFGDYTLVLVDQPAAGQPEPIRAGPSATRPFPSTPASIPPPYERPEPPLSRTSFGAAAAGAAAAGQPPDMTVISERDAVGYFTSLPQDYIDEAIVIELADYEWTVDVEQPAVYELTVTNGGNRVAMFNIQVQGLDSRWVEVVPPQLNLFEGQTGTAAITVAAPSAPTSYAGPYYLAVMVTSPNYPNRTSQIGATFIVKPFYHFSVNELSPKHNDISWFTKSSQTILTVANLGNSQTNYQLEGRDDERACSYEFQVPGETVPLTGQVPLQLPPQSWPSTVPDEGSLPPHIAEVPITIMPHRRPLFLRRRLHSFTISVSPLAGQEGGRSLRGELRQRPLFGIISVLLMTLLLLLLCGSSVWLLFGPRIYNFTVDDQVRTKIINSGDEVTLGWDASQFASLRITTDTGADIGRLDDSTGERVEKPLEDTIYTLEASNLLSPIFFFLDDWMTSERQVKVIPVNPNIRELTIEPDFIVLGEEAILSWNVTNADEVALSTGSGLPEPLPTDQFVHQRVVSPGENTTYSLQAGNFNGQTSKNAAITVVTPTGTPVPPPEVQYFSVSSNQIIQGESVVLNWSVTNADSVVINPIPGSLPFVHSVSQSPQETTLYVLEARKAGAAPVSRVQEVAVIIPTGTPLPTATPAAPNIIDFNASKTDLVLGGDDPDDNVTLFWTVQGEVTDVQLINSQNAIIQTQLTPQAQLDVPVDEDTTLFTLVAYNQDKSNRKSVTLNVATATPEPTATPPPTATPQAPIISFKAEATNSNESGKVRQVDFSSEENSRTYNVDARTRITLNWEVSNADSVTLEGFGPQPLEDEQQIPDPIIRSQNFTLTAKKEGRPDETAFIDIKVVQPDPPPPPTNFTGEEGTGVITLTWRYDPNLRDQIEGFRVYRDEPPNTLISELSKDDIDNFSNITTTDTDVEDDPCGNTYWVAVVYRDPINPEIFLEVRSISWSSRSC